MFCINFATLYPQHTATFPKTGQAISALVLTITLLEHYFDDATLFHFQRAWPVHDHSGAGAGLVSEETMTANWVTGKFVQQQGLS